MPLYEMVLPLIALLLNQQVALVAWERAPDLPAPVANNAVAGAIIRGRPMVFSFLGIDSTKRWDGIVNRAYGWKLGSPRWEELAPVPGPPRLAATAQVVRGSVYVFGGYTVSKDGSEESRAGVYRFDPFSDEWSQMTSMPLPVDDAVSGVWRDSLVYLISGWHDRDNVAAVQIYDPASDRWENGTPIPGSPVFGHAGAIAGDRIVYMDGVRTRSERPRFTMESSVWIGEIDVGKPERITWKRTQEHPGPALYRAAAGALGHLVLFAGGTGNPYNYDGVGYNGVRSVPRSGVFALDPSREEWIEITPLPRPTMDYRGMVVLEDVMIVVGGMDRDGNVTRAVQIGHRRGDTR